MNNAGCVMAENNVDVKRFVVECNELLSGKFLDLNRRLEKFLTTMTNSEDIVEYLSNCLENFDEDVEFDKAFSVDKKSGSVKITIPTDDKKKVALIVTIFNNISSGKLNTTQFLETYFRDGKLTGVQNFLEKIILPYRDAICKHFKVPVDVSADDIKKDEQEEKILQEEEKKAQEEAEFPHLDELLAEIVKGCNQILALLKFERKRTDILDDVEFVTNSIIRECGKRDLMVVNGLVIGLSYIAHKFKTIRDNVADINNMIFDYYEYLAQNSQEESTEND